MSEPASTRPPHKALIALTILAAAALYLLGNGRVSLWDRDEPRYAQCSRQMLVDRLGLINWNLYDGGSSTSA